MLIYEKAQKDKFKLEFNSEEELQQQLSKFENYSIQPNNVLLVDYNSFRQYIPNKYSYFFRLKIFYRIVSARQNQKNSMILLYHQKSQCRQLIIFIKRNLLHQDFMKFIIDISDHVNNDNVNIIIEILIRFNYDLLARADENSILEQFNTSTLQLISQYRNPNYPDQIYFGKLSKVLDLLLVPESRTRKHFGKFLSTLFNQAIQIQGEITEKIQECLDQLFLMIWGQVPKNRTRFDQYFQFWLDFLEEGKLQIQCYLDKNMILQD